MDRYVYAYHREVGVGKIFFRFPKLLDITSFIPKAADKTMTENDLHYHVTDAVVTALQGYIAGRMEIPSGDDPGLVRADGFVVLSVQQAMKLELYKVYRENCRSIPDLAKQIGKHETAVRRLLNLRHPSLATEIEGAIEFFGKRLIHCWDTETISPHSHSARLAMRQE